MSTEKNKRKARVRRGLKTKAIQQLSNMPILIVHRSNSHMYSQIVYQGRVMVSSSTLDKELKTSLAGNKVDRAKQVGMLLGQRAKAKDIIKVSFDRNGYKYHGRVKALADGAREEGLDF